MSRTRRWLIEVIREAVKPLLGQLAKFIQKEFLSMADQLQELSDQVDGLTQDIQEAVARAGQAEAQLNAAIADLQAHAAAPDLTKIIAKVQHARDIVKQIDPGTPPVATPTTPAPTTPAPVAPTTPVETPATPAIETTTETPATTPTQNAAQGTEASASADVHAPAENPTTGA